MPSYKSYIVNPDFQNEAIGWKNEDCEIITTYGYYTLNSIRFPANTACIMSQLLPIPFGSNWGTLMLVLTSLGTGVNLRIVYSYTDGTANTETINFASAYPTWYHKALSPTADKNIAHISIQHLVGYTSDVFLDCVLTVF